MPAYLVSVPSSTGQNRRRIYRRRMGRRLVSVPSSTGQNVYHTKDYRVRYDVSVPSSTGQNQRTDRVCPGGVFVSVPSSTGQNLGSSLFREGGYGVSVPSSTGQNRRANGICPGGVFVSVPSSTGQNPAKIPFPPAFSSLLRHVVDRSHDTNPRGSTTTAPPSFYQNHKQTQSLVSARCLIPSHDLPIHSNTSSNLPRVSG